MNAELRWIMAALDDDPTVRVVVLTGSGDQFCVGADTKALDFYKETDQTYGDTLHTSEMATPGHGAHPQFDHDLVWQWGMRVPIIAETFFKIRFVRIWPYPARRKCVLQPSHPAAMREVTRVFGHEKAARRRAQGGVASSLSRESERHPMKRLSQRGWFLG
jgi:Enoyl-CoA hydratase/isomerase